MNILEQNLGPSWKTTVGGTVAFVGVVLEHLPWPHCAEIGSALLAGGVGAGLLVAKDSDVSHSPIPLKTPDNVEPAGTQPVTQATLQTVLQAAPQPDDDPNAKTPVG